MAVDKIKKAVFIVPSEIYEKFIFDLKNLSCVEIIEQHQQKYIDNFLSFTHQQIKLLYTKIDSTINVLQKYYKNKSVSLTKEVFFDTNISSEIEDIKFLCEKVEKFNKDINNLASKISTIESKIQTLSDFYGININFHLLTKIKTLSFFFIKTSTKNFENFKKELKKFDFSHYWIHKKIKNVLFILICVDKKMETKFLESVKKFDIEVVNIYEIITTKSLEEEIEKLKSELNNHHKLIEDYKHELVCIAEENFEKIYNMYIKCLELLDFFSVQQNILTTKYTKIIYCWVPQKFLVKITNLVKNFSEVKVLFFDPEPNDDIPTVLSNRSISEPYEFVTTLYGLPKLGEVDPTNFLAPFFTLFFALCLSDTFYGLLMLTTWFLLRKKVPKYSIYYKFISLFKYLGLTSIIVGFFLGSVLGFNLIKDFKFPLNIAVLDPLNKPVDMLKFTFLLGLIQIIFGLIINTIKNLKNKNIFSAVDSLSWIVFIIVLSPVVYKLFFPQDISQHMLKLPSKIAIWIFLFIVIFQSRDIKPIFLKPINFFVKAYNTIGFYADILSYSRILALSLASAAIAQTINLLTIKLFHTQFLGIRYIEPIFAPVVFLVGHIFNFLISCLGGFVHSARLQYLEFFSKFFVSGGRPIKIFQPIRR